MHHYGWGWCDRRWFLREGRGGARGWMVLKGERWDGEICDFIGGWWWFGGGQHFWVVYTQGAIERGVSLADWVLHNCSFVSCSQSDQSDQMSERRACWLLVVVAFFGARSARSFEKTAILVSYRLPSGYLESRSSTNLMFGWATVRHVHTYT